MALIILFWKKKILMSTGWTLQTVDKAPSCEGAFLVS